MIRPRLAWFSPLPPQPGGVSLYSCALLEHIAPYADVEIITDLPSIDLPVSLQHLPVKRLGAFASEPGILPVYHMGNNVEQCAGIYEALTKHPGLVVVHDLNIHGFLLDYLVRRKHEPSIRRHLTSQPPTESHPYFRALTRAYGAVGAAQARKVLEARELPDIPAFPCHKVLTAASRAVIAHSRWAAEQLRQNGGPAQVFEMPQGMSHQAVPDAAVEAVRQRANLAPGEALIVSGGYLEPSRRSDVIVRAAALVRESGVRAKFVFAGKIAPDHRAYLEDLASRLRVREMVKFSGFLDSHEDFLAHLAAASVVIHLRYPTNGESSSTVLRALSLGKPCIVSDVDAYSELPDDCCWKAAPGPLEVPLVAEYLATITKRDDVGAAMGAAGKRLLEEKHAWPVVAARFLEIVQSTS